MNIRQQLSSVKRRYSEIDIPGGKAFIQSLSELERTTLFAEAKSDLSRLHALLIAFCLVDENKDRVYTEHDKDIEEILNLDSAVTSPIIELIQEHIVAPSFDETVKN